MRIKCWFESLEGKEHSKDLDVDGRILKWISNRFGGFELD
jgi:alpha-tubulin suppressor-like RCC1 family protein